MEKIIPEKAARQVLDACSDCDVCRFLMDASCPSCPTCSYMLRKVLGRGAYYSEAYQESVGGDEKGIKVPVGKQLDEHGTRKFESLSKTIYKGILRDDGYFSSISPLKRIKVAENTYDLGEYLMDLYKKGEISTDFGSVAGRNVYYPPCHLREQQIGQPYAELLKKIPGIELAVAGGAFDCCGLAGVMGFKREFHDASVRMGSPLMEKIQALKPERIVTDCLSCRLQFEQLLPYDVVHPIEILHGAYAGDRNEMKASAGAGFR